MRLKNSNILIFFKGKKWVELTFPIAFHTRSMEDGEKGSQFYGGTQE